jgi:hypothetical protein
MSVICVLEDHLLCERICQLFLYWKTTCAKIMELKFFYIRFEVLDGLCLSERRPHTQYKRSAP